MNVNSMTGFARRAGECRVGDEAGGSGWSWVWEVRSVNSKGLDVRMRLPSVAEGWEASLKETVRKRVERGSISINWSLEHASAQGEGNLAVDEGFLRQIIALQERLEGEGLVFPTAPNLDRLLAIRGVVEQQDRSADETVVAGIEAAAKADFAQLLDDLVTSRASEGARLEAVLLGHLADIAELASRAASVAETQPAILKARMEGQLASLLEARPPVSEERLAQELAMLATKADVREEIDRLTSHITACRELLAKGGAIGRKLDFLCQELNREANTICSKALELELTNIGVDLKTHIERFREQVQNVE